MEEKLRKLMKHEGINSTRLAEILGIQASGISHIMSGRNKPSYDFLLKLLQRFPQINPDWLLLDKGPMYRNEIKTGTASVVRDTTATYNASGSAPVPAQKKFFEPDNNDIIPSGRPGQQPSNTATAVTPVTPLTLSTSSASPMPAAGGFTRTSSIERIVVFYKDKTFSEYRPEQPV